MIRPTLAFATSAGKRFGTSSKNRIFSTKVSDLISNLNTEQFGDTTEVLNPLIVCGPSGVGKGTIIQKFMDEFGGKLQFGFTTSHTTRVPREGEQDGEHYHFVSRKQMERLLQEGFFIESAEVHGNYYGTSWQALRDVQNGAGNKRCLLDIDVQGVQNIKKLEKPGFLEPYYIFIAPPSLDSLKERLMGRGSESGETMTRRLGNSAKELAYGMKPGNFDAIIVNDNLETAVQEFTEVVRSL